MTPSPPTDEPLRPRSRVPGLVPLLITGLVMGGFLAVGAVVQALDLAFGLWFSELFIFLGVSWVTLEATGWDPVRHVGLDGWLAPAVITGVLVGLFNYFAWAAPLMWVAEHVFPQRIVELFDGAQVFRGKSTFELVALTAGVSLAAPLCEEFFFRGVLQPGLAQRLDPPRAVVVTALIFAAFHFDPVGFLARFQLGVVFGLLAWRSGSIWPAVAAHAANNAVSSALYFALDGTSRVDRDVPEWAVVASLMVGNLLILAVVRFTEVFPDRFTAPRPARPTSRPPRPVLVAALPWLAAALGSLIVLLAVNPRGVALNAIDVATPLLATHGRAEQPPDAGPTALETLRQRAKRGEVPLTDYWQARKDEAEQRRHPDAGPPEAPGER